LRLRAFERAPDLIFGVALGNLLRGVPLDARATFQGTFAFLLNPYALLVGVFRAVATLAQHGAIFARCASTAPWLAEPRECCRRLWWAVLPLYLAVSGRNVCGARRPSPWLLRCRCFRSPRLPACHGVRDRKPGARFRDVVAFVGTLWTAAACTIFPYLIPAFPSGTWRPLDLRRRHRRWR
jgi:cytochrome bd-type quinol oxidase subunit 2